MKKILVSACLLGETCRYDGGSNPLPVMEELRRRYDIIPFCPETEGGLPTPRDPAERKGNSIKTKAGKNVTKEYELGAEKALRLCRYLGIEVAILKENSPSCGVHQIHNGRFDGRLIPGKGVTTALLERNGIKVYSEHEIPDFLESLLLEERKKEEIRRQKEEAKKKEAEEKAAKEAEIQKAKKEEERPFAKKEKPFGAKKGFPKRKSFPSKGKPFRKKKDKE